MSEFWFIALTFCAGAAVGALIAVQICRGKESTRLKKELEELQEEYARYKENVGRHFVQTSTLINNLTQSYKDVHQHLSNGAQSLCDGELAMELRKSTTPLIANAIDGVAEPAPEEPAAKTEEPKPEPETEPQAESTETEPAAEKTEQPEDEAPSAVAEEKVEPDTAEESQQESEAQSEPVAAEVTESEEPVAGDNSEQEHSSEADASSDKTESSDASSRSESKAEEEHVNLEEIMRMAQGAAGAKPDADNLAQIARNAEGAYLEEEETPEPEIVVPEADKERASS